MIGFIFELIFEILVYWIIGLPFAFLRWLVFGKRPFKEYVFDSGTNVLLISLTGALIAVIMHLINKD